MIEAWLPDGIYRAWLNYGPGSSHEAQVERFSYKGRDIRFMGVHHNAARATQIMVAYFRPQFVDPSEWLFVNEATDNAVLQTGEAFDFSVLGKALKIPAVDPVPAIIYANVFNLYEGKLPKNIVIAAVTELAEYYEDISGLTKEEIINGKTEKQKMQSADPKAFRKDFKEAMGELVAISNTLGSQILDFFFSLYPDRLNIAACVGAAHRGMFKDVPADSKYKMPIDKIKDIIVSERNFSAMLEQRAVDHFFRGSEVD